jgi:predicted NAD/FAD-dependent oxidoreductase
MRIAIVGAGFSGCYLASQLVKKGHEVILFEKSRGAGGRMSTRTNSSQQHINHGCNQIQVKSGLFQNFCEHISSLGLLVVIGLMDQR